MHTTWCSCLIYEKTFIYSAQQFTKHGKNLQRTGQRPLNEEFARKPQYPLAFNVFGLFISCAQGSTYKNTKIYNLLAYV